MNAVNVFQRTLTGPARSRHQKPFMDFLSRQVEDYFQELIREAAKLFRFEISE